MKAEVNIRQARLQDAEALLDIYRPYVEKTAITFEWSTPSVQEFRERMERTLRRYPYIVAESDGEVVGYCYLGPFVGRDAYDWNAETSIYVKEKERGKGIGGALYREIEAIAGKMNIQALEACIGFPDPEDEYLTLGSVRFHERMGYAQTGRFHRCGYKFSRWYDMVWMEKVIAGRPDPMPVFVPFPEL